jgi:hypothetical protein
VRRGAGYLVGKNLLDMDLTRLGLPGSGYCYPARRSTFHFPGRARHSSLLCRYDAEGLAGFAGIHLVRRLRVYTVIVRLQWENAAHLITANEVGCCECAIRPRYRLSLDGSLPTA